MTSSLSNGQRDSIPPWQDMPTLFWHICCTPNTVDKWVKEGILPPPRKRGGKQMWRWSEVDEYLSRDGDNLDPEAERIRHATRRAEANA
jgi:predicted DNA-binding transcriptional regulator AlpA